MKTRRATRSMSKELRAAAERVVTDIAATISTLGPFSDAACERWREAYLMEVSSPVALVTKVNALVDFAVVEFRSSDNAETIATLAKLCAVRDGLRSAEAHNA